MGRAILASAAISGLVLPIHLDGRIATDGGWVRNFPFEHAYRNPEVRAIAAFRYVPSYPPTTPRLPRAHARTARAFSRRPTGASPPRGGATRAGTLVARGARALRRAHRSADARRVRPQRGGRGALRTGTRDLRRRAPASARGRHRSRNRGGGAMATHPPPRRARRPLRSRALPVSPRPARSRADRARLGGDAGLDPTFRSDAPWPTELKRALVERGYALTDEALARSELEDLDHHSAR